MKPEDSDYKPLGNFLRGIESTPPETSEELKLSLKERGFDSDRIATGIHLKVKDCLDGRRLAWMEKAKSKQNAFEAILERVKSWKVRSIEEIETAFANVQRGQLGTAAQNRLQVAFRNLASIPPEDKAAFLDDLEVLKELQAQNEKSSESNQT